MAADTLILMQKAVSELHRVFITVGDYIKKKAAHKRSVV